MVDGAHVGFRHCGNGAKNALFAAAGAGAVARDQRVVVGANHEQIAQRGRLRFRGIGRIEEAEILLRGIGQQIEESRASLVLGIYGFRLRDHAERIVIAAGGYAGSAALAQIGDEDGDDAAGKLGLLRSGDEKIALTLV